MLLWFMGASPPDRYNYRIVSPVLIYIVNEVVIFSFNLPVHNIIWFIINKITYTKKVYS